MNSEPLDGPTAARIWLQQRVDAQTAAAAQNVLRETAEVLSIASGDGVAVRVCSRDLKWLLPLAAHHPNPTIQVAMWEAMCAAAVPVDGGVWAPIMGERRTVAYDVRDRNHIPPNALPVQIEFFRNFPVTFILGAPVILQDAIVGCVTLVRYVSQEQFSDNDGLLLEDVARRAASAIDFGRLTELDLETGMR